MEINLKQAELFKAIRQYLENQGFHTRGKEVTINVSGGRGNTGAWAAISIEDIDIPGFEADSDDAPIIEMANADIRADFADKLLNLAEQGEQTAKFLMDVGPEPAAADATPVPSLDPEVRLAEEIDAIGLPETAELPPAILAVAKEEPVLGMPDSELFGTLPAGQPEAEEGKPATPSPSSLFDE